MDREIGASEAKRAVVVGGSKGIGLAIAKSLAERGETVVVTSRDLGRAEAAAHEIGGKATGLAVDLSAPEGIAAAFAGIGPVNHLVIGAFESIFNPVKDFSVPGAQRLATIKLVGYVETVHALLPRFGPGAAVVLIGGQAREFPYTGGAMVSAVNGAVTTLVKALSMELGPIRVNAIHPGLVIDSPRWAGATEAAPRVLSRTPSGHVATMADCADAVRFLLDNPAVSGANLVVDGGFGVGLA